MNKQIKVEFRVDSLADNSTLKEWVEQLLLNSSLNNSEFKLEIEKVEIKSYEKDS